jgi:regulator of cell morphogenesis and NO signaling
MPSTESTSSSVTADTALAAIALRSDAHAAILARHRLDFCCAGRRTLSQACVASGLDVTAVLAELDAEVRARAAAAVLDGPNWSERPLAEVVDFVVNTHHAFTRAAVARITPLMAKVAGKHGDRHGELVKIAGAFASLAADMEAHMVREERVLFPYVRSLALAASGPPASPPFGTVKNPVRMMMAEHDGAAELLAQLQEATGDFTAPADACTSYRALYAALAELRLDLMRHVSLENNVLFPRAIDLEQCRQATPAMAAPPR